MPDVRHHRYEVYVHAAAPLARVASTRWSWSKLNERGFAVAQGTQHESLAACFAEIRNHRDRFGDAPIAINLLGKQAMIAPGAPDLEPYAEPDEDEAPPLRRALP